MNGNTEFASGKISEITGAKLIKIEPEKAYPNKGMRKFLKGGRDAIRQKTPKLLPYEFDASLYDEIIFGFPVWASNVTPPLRSFIDENMDAIKSKTVAAFVCCSGGGAEKTLNSLKEYLGLDSFKAELILIDPKDKPKDSDIESIKAFCEKL
jgi:flavodoxin